CVGSRGLVTLSLMVNSEYTPATDLSTLLIEDVERILATSSSSSSKSKKKADVLVKVESLSSSSSSLSSSISPSASSSLSSHSSSSVLSQSADIAKYIIIKVWCDRRAIIREDIKYVRVPSQYRVSDLRTALSVLFAGNN